MHSDRKQKIQIQGLQFQGKDALPTPSSLCAGRSSRSRSRAWYDHTIMPMAPSEFSAKKVKLRDHQHDARMTAEHAYKPTLPELNPSISAGISSAPERVSEGSHTLDCEFGDNFRARKGELGLHNRGLTEQIHPPTTRTLRVYCLPR